MNLAEWLHAAARRNPHAPALLAGNEVVSDYADFAASARSIGARLGAEYGVRPGDRVGLYMTNSTRYLELLYGVWWCGAVAVPINRKLAPTEVAAIADDAGTTVIVADTDLAGVPTAPAADDSWRCRQGLCEPVPREMDDVAWLFYTSGTTGAPKGVMLTNGNLLAMSLCRMADVDPISPEDAVLYAAPLSHGAGLYALAHVRMGSKHVFPPSGRFDAGEMLTLAAAVGNVSLFAAPTMVRRLVAEAKQRGGQGHGLKTVIYGGGPMYLADIEEAISVLGQRFAQIYGQGESPMTITALSKHDHRDVAHPKYADRLASVGTAQSAVQVRVRGADGKPAPPGETGEIEVKGATVMAGYWRNPAATAEALHDGWLRTGDLGRLDEDGYLTLVGRSKELIISGGSNVYPREVEDVLVAHPDIAEAAVVGVPDPEWGELVVAFVVPAGGAVVDESELDRHCLGLIARFKRPRRYHIVADLPKNAYGKVVKKSLLRAALAAH